MGCLHDPYYEQMQRVFGELFISISEQCEAVNRFFRRVGNLLDPVIERRINNAKRSRTVTRQMMLTRRIDPRRLDPSANSIRLRPGQPLRRPAVRNTLPQHGHDQRQRQQAG